MKVFAHLHSVSSAALAMATFAASPAIAAQPQPPVAQQTTPGAQDAAGDPLPSEVADKPSKEDAASAPAEGVATDQDIVVTGLRASLASAQAIKRNSSSIVDSIVAQDIGKLPDINVAEALQRISGVQIRRSRGEGSGIAIRGLTQIRTELDGRSIFSGGGRTLDLTSVPSELLAGADVFKSISADRIEGGIGGLIDLRLRKPFDFKGLEVAGQVRGTYYDLANKAEPAISGLVSNRWETGMGDIGLLVAGVYQKTANRNDALDGGGNVATRGVLDLDGNGSKTDQADTVVIQTGRGVLPSIGKRERLGFNGALQWQASPELLFHVDGAYNQFKDQSYTYAVYTNPINSIVDQNGLVVPGAVGNDIQVFEGTGNFKSGTINNNEVFPFIWGSKSKTTIWQAAGGAKYESGPVHLFADLSYTKTTGSGWFRQIAMRTTAPTVFLDFGQSYPSFRVGGVDLTDPNAVNLSYAADYPAQNDGSELAWKGDATFDVESGFLKAMKFGIRYADRQTSPISFGGQYKKPGVPLSQVPFLGAEVVDLKTDLSPALLTRGFGSGFTASRFLGPSPDILFKDWDKLRSYYGNPQLSATSYDLTEKTFAGYAMAEFDSDVGGIRISGNAGIRVIRTATSSTGTLALPSGATRPISVSSAYVSALPMLNVKADITEKLVLRGALSKALTRPDFGALSPVLNLDFVYRTGSSGNPALGPIRANQADLSAEYYFTSDSFAYVAGFAKNVDGFLTNVGIRQNVPGEDLPFVITQPVNGTAGKIRGFEVGWNQFLTFLPGMLSGLGFQANYTYVYSAAPSPIVGSTEQYPLVGLSKHSYNLVGIYEKGPLSLRVAYNWRDRFFNSLNIGANTVDPDYFAAAGYLDASVNIDLTRKISIFADANNLTRAKSITYYDVPQRPHAYGGDDRRFSAGARFRF